MANLHEGHRQRLKERFLREGLDHFEPHTVLELLLFYAVPQRDTNELAHRLIARFLMNCAQWRGLGATQQPCSNWCPI